MNGYLRTFAIASIALAVALFASSASAQDEESIRARDLADQIRQQMKVDEGRDTTVTVSPQDTRILVNALFMYYESRTYDTRVVTPKYVDVEELANMLHIFNASFHSSDRTNTLLMRAPKNQLDTILDVVQRLDVRPVENAEANVELTVNLVQGSLLENTGDIAVRDVPSYLEEVIDELGKVFTYTQYSLVDTLLLRCRNNSEASTSGLLPQGSSDSDETTYDLRINSVRVTEGDVRSVRLSDLSFSAWMPNKSSANPPTRGRAVPPQHRQMGIKADIDVREGQHVVVGKASLSTDDIALFVVVSAKIIDG